MKTCALSFYNLHIKKTLFPKYLFMKGKRKRKERKVSGISYEEELLLKSKL